MAKKLKRRADGRYAKQITIGIVDGKQKKKTVYGRTIQEVEKKYRDFIQLYEKGIILNSDNITLGELMNEWYHLKKENYIQFNTKLSYETRMKVIHRTIGVLPVKNVRTYHIQSLMNDMLRDEHTASAKLMLIMLSNIFDYAITIDLLYKNPCKAVQIKHTIQRKRILTPAEKNNVLTADLNARDRALLSLLRYTGVRRGELLALTRDDIDWIHSSIRINKTLIDVKGKGEINYHTKTEAGMPIKKLQAWVGHANITTTLNIYTHLEQQVIDDCSDINAYYENTGERQ